MIINWESAKVSGERRSSYRSFLIATVQHGLASLGHPVPCDDQVLLDMDGLTIRFASELDENVIDYDTLDGGGEFDLAATGHDPLLILLYAQKRFREEFKLDQDQLAFCDAAGNLIQPKGWEQIRAVLADFEDFFDCLIDDAREKAELIGLIPGPINITGESTIADIEDAWF